MRSGTGTGKGTICMRDGWTGLDWAGLDWTGLDKVHLYCSFDWVLSTLHTRTLATWDIVPREDSERRVLTKCRVWS